MSLRVLIIEILDFVPNFFLDLFYLHFFVFVNIINYNFQTSFNSFQHYWFANIIFSLKNIYEFFFIKRDERIAIHRIDGIIILH